MKKESSSSIFDKPFGNAEDRVKEEVTQDTNKVKRALTKLHNQSPEIVFFGSFVVYLIPICLWTMCCKASDTKEDEDIHIQKTYNKIKQGSAANSARQVSDLKQPLMSDKYSSHK